MDKSIIWLEDNQVINSDVAELLEKYFSVIPCKNLVTFRQAIEDNHENTAPVAGFVIDVMLEEHDLSDLGLEVIETENGLTAGLAVVEHYLSTSTRHQGTNIDQAQAFSDKPILILTVLDAPDENDCLNKAKAAQPDRIKYLTKRYDHTNSWLKDIEGWLKACR